MPAPTSRSWKTSSRQAIIPFSRPGGITTIEDLRALEDLGIAAAVIGMALYTGALDARTIAEEFTEEIKT